MKKLMLAICSTMAVVGMALAGTPTSFAYQGVLRDETGAPLNQEQATITFRLYDAASGGNKLWEKGLTLAIGTNGLFSAELSGGNLAQVIADAEKNGQPLYVGLTVADSAGEVSPRQKLVATALAAYAQNVAQADGNFTVRGTATFEGEACMNGANTTFRPTNVQTTGRLAVSGKATLEGTTELNGTVTVSDRMTVSGDGTLMVEGSQLSIPVGMIMMWAGSESEVPTDCWALCDGKTEFLFKGVMRKVPDLRGRFIVGVGAYTDAEGNSGTYDPDETGGVNLHKLTKDEMPSHAHTIDKGHNQVEFAHADHYVFGDTTDDQHTSGDYDTCAAGGDKAHENRPPYYALCYIIKIK